MRWRASRTCGRMGGLKRYLPVTFITMMIGTLAIAGIPIFAGFFSKDEILFRTFLTSKTRVGRCRRYGDDDGVLHVPADGDDVLRDVSRSGMGTRDSRRGSRRCGSWRAASCRSTCARTGTQSAARRIARSGTTITIPVTTRTAMVTAHGTARTSHRRP